MWKVFCTRFRISQQTVVLVLIHDQVRLDDYALAHLGDYMDRKYAKQAVILFHDKKTYRQIKKMHLEMPVRLCRWPEGKIENLYDYYSFYKFSDRIVFTYTDRPEDNQLGKILRETDIEEEEAVCLGLYRLRRVPARKKNRNKRVKTCLIISWHG